MEINISRETLVTALQIVTPITNKSFTKPILSNFILKADNGKIEFSATDYELSIEGTAEAEVKRPGEVCVSAKKLLEAAREFLSDEIRIVLDDQLWITVEGGSARMRLPSMEIGLYPQMEKADPPHKFSVRADELKRTIDLTIFATQANEARKNLMGVCLQLDDGTSTWTSTDGHRLSRVTREVTSQGEAGAPDIIIPRKSLTEMQKVLEGEDQVSVAFSDRILVLTTPQVTLTTRLIEGKFPNVEQVIPKDSDKQAVIPRERLINSLKLISLMSTDKIRPAKLTFALDQLTLESEKVESGDARDEVSMEYSGDAQEIGFNTRYLLEVLNVLHGDQVEVELKGALNPVLLRSPQEPEFLSVVMPLRIEW